MLTGLDFPRELYYGPEGLWLRNDGAGAARLGVHFYTLPTQSRVVHVHLPRAGEAFLKGDEIGYLDMEGTTFPLIAPVSGVVFVPNPDLRRDADLVRTDAFGEGYLLDIEEVDPNDVSELLDAEEAMASFSSVDVDASKPRAAMRVEPDRPWWTSLELGFGEQVFLHARIVPPLSNEIFAPDWAIGQRWAVETLVGQDKRIYDFEVLGEAKVAGEPVMRIQATERVGELLTPDGVSLARPPIARVLYIRTRSFTLLCWDIVPTDAPTLFERHWNERGENAHMRYLPEDGFFYDFPFLPPGKLDLTREHDETATLPGLVDYYRFRGGGYRCEVELRSRLMSDTGVEERWFSQQIWIAGQPWWSEAVRMRGDKVLIKASLLAEQG